MKYIIISFLLILLNSCSSSHKTEGEESKKIISVDLNGNKENAATFFNYSHSIVLETTDECLIKEISKIEFYKGNIYILDSQQGCIFVYGQDGKFIYKIDKKGESPEQYLSIDDFYIDKEVGCLYIYDGFSGYILAVDFQGNFQYRINIPKGYSFIKLENGNWLIYLGNGAAASSNRTFNNLLWYDEDFVLIKERFPINKELLGRRYTVGGMKSVFSVYYNQIFFLPLLDKKIYVYNSESDKLVPEYEIQYTPLKYNATLDEQAKAPKVQQYIESMNNGGIPSRINNFYEFRNSIIFNFSFDGTPLMYFYDKVNDRGKVCNFGFHENGLIFNPPSIYFNDKEDELILSIVNSSLFAFCKNENAKGSEVVEDISRRIGNIEDPNPILVFYSLKDY